jgi:flagellar biosynthesis/type III secretory pathway chaperone
VSQDPDLCREHVAKLLTEENGCLEELAQLLEREHQILKTNDIVALQAAIKQRQACVGRIVRIEDERRSLCRMLGHTADVRGLEQLLRWCDPKGTLSADWALCTTRAKRCREFNGRNGALVHARLTRVQALLGVLTGRPAELKTYGRGASFALARIGRVLTIEA